ERNWLSFQAGEIRVCASCHGINTLSQTGDPAPTNEPEALRDLLADWKLANGGGPGAPTPVPTPVVGPTATPVPGGPEDCTTGIAATKTRLKATCATAAITVSGTATIPEPWAGVDPLANGIRVTLEGVLDVTIPSGSGWSVNKKGTRWRFEDASGAHGGVR